MIYMKLVFQENIKIKLLNYNDYNYEKLKIYDKILPQRYRNNKKNNKKCILFDYKYNTFEMRNNTQANNSTNDCFLDNGTKKCLPNIYNYYINNFKYTFSIKKYTNCNINIDFSKELDVKLKPAFFNNKKSNNKKKNKKRYLQEYKLICNIYDIL